MYAKLSFEHPEKYGVVLCVAFRGFLANQGISFSAENHVFVWVLHPQRLLFSTRRLPSFGWFG